MVNVNTIKRITKNATMVNVDKEVSFRLKSNRNINANVAETNQDLERSLEEGECSESTEGDASQAKNRESITKPMSMVKVIDKKIDDSMNKVHRFFEEKFRNLSRVAELERQLAENKRHLKMLKN